MCHKVRRQHVQYSVCGFSMCCVFAPVSIFVCVRVTVIPAATASPHRPVNCGRWQDPVGFEPSTLPLLMPHSTHRAEQNLYAELALMQLCLSVSVCVSVCLSLLHLSPTAQISEHPINHPW